jgi:S-DNA-T family DNA segregation ATPase FtsK/SpoIIIE
VKLKFTVVRERDDERDVVVTADVTATIGDIAAALVPRETDERSTGPLTLRAEFPGGRQARILNHGAQVHESSLRSGCRVEVVPVGERRRGDERDDTPAALVKVIAGPESGREYRLQRGVNLVGRDTSAAVFLGDDAEVSRRHATLTVADNITVADLNSANGVHVEGMMVQRAIVTGASRIRVGTSLFQVVALNGSGAGDVTSTEAAFSRSPRVEAAYRGTSFTLPEIPGPVTPPRLPFLVLLSPLLLGAAMFFFTGNVLSLLFIAISPLIMIGTWIDNRVQGKRKARSARRDFEEGMADVRVRLLAGRDIEVSSRQRESPDTIAVAQAMRARSPLLWTRKPEHTTFLEVRFGSGEQSSRCSVVLPTKNGGVLEDWTRARELAAEFDRVYSVPVVETFARAGSIGVAGAGLLAQDAARALVVQLAGLHSPADLAIAAFAGGAATETWSWLKWLPHVDSPHCPVKTNCLVSDYAAGTTLLAELEGLISSRRAAGQGRGDSVRSRLDESRALDEAHGAAVEMLPAVPAVLVVVSDEPVADRSRLVALAEEGADHGVFVLWTAASVEALPVVCRTYLALDAATGRGRVGFVRSGQEVPLGRLELADTITAETAARALAPVEDTGARVLDETDLPHTVDFADLYEVALMSEPDAVVKRWAKNDSLTRAWTPGAARDAGGIRAVVGQGPAEPFALDLRTHGPHALVGGTTGSGKSEFLQSWIMGIAAEYSPDRVTFLLVDYKGGSAFGECVGLPHTVGLVTDLTPHLVRRALTSLRAELRHREHLLNAKGAKDLETLEKRSEPDAPPALILVIDEFAALASEVPEFVDGVIDVGQRGRSLGLHLIMATQRPSGVIKDSLRANTNLRVALRVADEADSTDVLGVPVAAEFDPGTPGRAAAKLGPGRVADFQAAYLGGRTRTVGSEPDVHVRDLPFGPGQSWAVRAREFRPVEGGARDIERLAATIARAADAQHLELPRRPWLDQLPDLVDLDELRAARDNVPLGIVDEPESQTQRTLDLDLDAVGTLVVVGAGGAGKSTAIRTVAVSAAASAPSHPVIIHAIDFAGGALTMLERLPVVSSVVSGSDVERVTRMLKTLTDAVEARATAFAAARAASLTDYGATRGERLPRLILAIDGFGAFRSEYEFRNGGALFDRLLAIASTGRQLGVHLVLTADRMGAFPSALAANVGARIVLRLAGESEYSAAGVDGGALAEAPSGRALVDGHEVQLAVPGGTADLVVQARRVDELAARLREAAVPEAEPIERLPTHIPAADLPGSVGGFPTLGIDDETLDPIGLPLDGLFIVTGPFGSGRTTAMTTAVRAVRVARPELRPYLIVPRHSALATVTDWAERSTDAPDDSEVSLAERLAVRLEESPNTASASMLIVIESVGDFEGLPAESDVVRLLKAARRAGVTVLAEADTVTAPSAWQLYAELKTARAGIVLQPEEGDGLGLFRVSFPRVTRAEFPVGRGILVAAGALSRVQVAVS